MDETSRMSKGVLEHTFKGMYVVPILAGTFRPPDIYQYWLFLERNGTRLIQIDATPDTAVVMAKGFAYINEIHIIGEPVVSGDIIYLVVDSANMDLNAFYYWREVTAGTIPSKELWRPFVWISSEGGGDTLGINKLLDNICLGEAHHTAYRLIAAARDLKRD